jgi:hypothetical protein
LLEVVLSEDFVVVLTGVLRIDPAGYLTRNWLSLQFTMGVSHWVQLIDEL